MSAAEDYRTGFELPEDSNPYSVLDPGSTDKGGWNPEALDFENWEPEVEKHVERAEERFDRDIRDSFRSGRMENLPAGAVGATVPDIDIYRNGVEKSSDLLLDSSEFYTLDELQQDHSILHEDIHARANSGELYTDLLQEGMPADTVKYLAEIFEYGDTPEVEGATEFVALFLDDNSDLLAGDFYPFETAMVSDMLRYSGSHPDYQLAKEIEEGKQETLSELVMDYYSSIELEDALPEGYDSFSGTESYGSELYGAADYSGGYGGGSAEHYEDGENGFENPVNAPWEEITGILSTGRDPERF
ncbi:MAG: hypothetical protein ABEI58_01980 [Candidatus Nanohaloarchaea archaeon]